MLSYSGSVAPFLIAWTLYQGSILMRVLNWTGLVVNGFVAFLLPMYLVLRSIGVRRTIRDRKQAHNELELLSHSTEVISSTIALTPVSNTSTTTTNNHAPSLHLHAPHSSSCNSIHSQEHTYYDGSLEGEDPERFNLVDSSVKPLPDWLEPYRYYIVMFMIVCFALIIGGTIVLDVYMGIQPEE